MPTPQEFMEQVIAWPGPEGPGYVNLHWKTPHLGTKSGKPVWGGRPFKELKPLLDLAQWGATKPSIMQDIYFCLSTQGAVGPMRNNRITALRSAATALVLKAIWLDVDVGKDKGYATLDAALTAISKFYKDANLPPPSAFVFSGGGIHVYWISDVPLTVSEWRPYAEGLREEATRLGLKFDAGVTTDEARILRVPGTFNYKTMPPRACRLAGLGRNYNFAVDLGRLATITPTKVTAAVIPNAVGAPFDLSAFAGYRPPPCMAGLDATNDSLANGINVHDDRPLSPDAVIQNCPHIQEAMVTHGKGYSQGLWMQDVLLSTFLEDGRVWGRHMSKDHKTFDEDDYNAMYDRKVEDRKARGLGWPGCQAFENEGCTLCKTCVFKGKIKSPLNLAERSLPAAHDPPPLPPSPPELYLPAYPLAYTVGSVDNRTVIGAMIMHPPVKGEPRPEFIPFFYCSIHHPWTKGGVDGALHFKADVAKDTTFDITITDAEMATEQTLVQALCRQRCKPTKQGERYLVEFMRAWTQRRDDEFKRQDTVPYGWVFEDSVRTGFAYGGKVFEDTGKVREAGHADKTINIAYMPTGKINPFLELLEIICSQNNAGIEVLVAAAFAAPLMAISGEDNGILWAHSNASGAHKTTSLLTGAAVWGNPKQAKEKSTTSMLYLENKLGVLCNLPIILDEIREVRHVEQMAGHIGNFTEGSSGGKMKRDRSTLMIAGSNQSLAGVTLKHNKDTDAALMRVFEVELPKLEDTHSAGDVRRLVESLNHNYGQVGLLYAEHLGKNHKDIFEYGIKLEKGFQKEVGFKSEERFWSALCTSVIYGAYLANVILKHEYFHVDMIHDWLVKKYFEQRAYAARNLNVAGTSLNVIDVLGQFFKHVANHHLWTESMPKRGAGRPSTVIQVKAPERLPVHVRWGQQEQIVQISKEALVIFCHDVYHQPFDAVWRGLAKNFQATQERLSLSAGIHSIGQTNETVIQFDVPQGSPFYDMLMTGKAPAKFEMPHVQETGLFAKAAAQAASDAALVNKTTEGL
jgi:Domain of unknown function (DUF927)